MPYERTEIDLDCNISFCAYWDCGSCGTDEEVEDLRPSNIDCRFFHFNSVINTEDADTLIEQIEELGIPFVNLDPESTSFLRRPFFSDSEPFQCIIRGSEEDLPKFNFYKTVDGGIGFTNKDQLSLEL